MAALKGVAQKAKSGTLEAAQLGVFGGYAARGAHLPGKTIAMNKASTIIRTTLAVAGFAALHYSGAAIATSAIAASLVSLPAVALAGGTWLMCKGAVAAVATLSTGILAELGMGLGAVVAGWNVLERHDAVPFGLAEMSGIGLTEKLAQLIMGS